MKSTSEQSQSETKLCPMCGVSGGAFLAFIRIDYEGIYEGSIKLFKSKTAADKYISELKKENGGDSVTYDIVELHFH